jgi:His Kinase A (phospho-acceptor) domain
MRFDDMIATVLERPVTRPDQRAAQWRQLVDLLAQERPGASEAVIERAYDRLDAWRSQVELGLRQRAAAAYAGLPIAPRLLAFFAADHPQVASAALRGARLDEAEWLSLLPHLTPTGRAMLRHRRDLPNAVTTALASFGASDFVLGSDAAPAETAPAPAAPAQPEPAEPHDEPPSQIRELVDRIEAFQKHRHDEVQHTPAEPADEFRWETGPEGLILWVDGAPRGPLVGQSIAAIAERGQHGVDGQAAGAFHRRAPFRDARFTVPGDGAAAGSWRISGVPYFASHRGTFLGYRGAARRPRFDEEAAPLPDREASGGLFGTDLQPDSLRQLVHELRTPLNAIIGFAEMIEGQYMGPAGTAYRGRATDIAGHARRLLGAVDDLDTAARIETSRLDLTPSRTDAAALLMRLRDAFACEASDRQAHLAVAIIGDLPDAAIEGAAAERMLSRLLAAAIGLAEHGETIAASLKSEAAAGRTVLRLSVDRPGAIAGLDEMFLLHPGYSPEGDWPAAPALGLGFALRLVRKLAEAAGGGLEIRDDRFELTMPAAVDDAAGNGRGESGGA